MSTVIPFSQALRERTAAVHSDTESSAFITELLSGKRSKDDYIALVGQLYFIYEALEDVAERLKTDAIATAFISPQLTRLPALEADLAFLVGDDWQGAVLPLPATARYVQRIHDMADWPGGFVAHHYTRYLGDLSGGQVIRTLLQRQFGFETNGVGFYIFAKIAKPKLFKDSYRAELDALDWDDAERARVIGEANLVFRLNAELFADLAEATAAVAA